MYHHISHLYNTSRLQIKRLSHIQERNNITSKTWVIKLFFRMQVTMLLISKLQTTFYLLLNVTLCTVDITKNRTKKTNQNSVTSKK